MNDDIQREMERRFKPQLDRLQYLHDRWQDERAYEPWADYVEAMRKLAPAETEFVKATKRPFGFEVHTKRGLGVRFFASATRVGFDTFTMGNVE